MIARVKIPNTNQPDELLPTRQSLLSRLRDHADNVSWQEFFNTYWKLIYGVALRSGLNDSEAQDVVQETIISVAKHLPDFKYDRSKGSFKSWLLQMTKWRITDHLRRRRREAGLHILHHTEPGSTSTIERIPDPVGVDAVWEEEWQKNLFAAALQAVKAKVKPRHFQVFDLYVLRKWPVAKVTAALGVNLGQIYLAKHRITAALKKEIKRLENRY